MDERTKRLLARSASLGLPVPTSDGDELRTWLATPGPGDPHGIGRYLAEIWRERVDLQEAFPGLMLDPEQRGRFLLWAHHFAAGECAMPVELVPDAPAGVTDLASPTVEGPPPPLRRGVSVVGYLRAVLGLGGSARRLAQVAAMAGEHVDRRTYDHTTSPLDHPWVGDLGGRDGADDDGDRVVEDRNDIVVLCVNGSETPRLTRALGPKALHGRYRIGLWFWELDVLPPAMTAGFDHVDEVWVTSAFVRDAVEAAAPARVAVRVIPLGTDVVLDANASERSATHTPTRMDLGLPASGLLLGISFDYASRIERKNPLGLIDAFSRAFPQPFSLGPERGPWLVLKTLNRDLHADDARRVDAAAAPRADVLVVDRQFDFASQRALLRELDVLVSLHRAEGYGNSLLEAMGHGHPVIATGYSGNLAFMDASNSWLVPSQLVPVGGDGSLYPPDAHWADPDLDAAAAMMRAVALGIDAPDVRARAAKGARDVAPVLDGTLAAAFIRRRLAEIRGAR